MFSQENTEKVFKDLEIKDQYFENLRFAKCKFINCYFENTKFISSRFSECKFSKCTLINLDFTQTVFDDTEFYETKVFTINWSLIRDFHTKLRFLKSKVHYCTFQDLELIEFEAIESELFENDFVNCRLDKSVWDETKLPRTNFHKCFLKDADFTHAKEYLISAKENKIVKTKFAWPEVSDSLRLLGMEVEN